MTDQVSPCGQIAARQLSALVNRLGRTLHCLQFADGLNPAQWEALRYVGRANRFSRTPSALAQYLGTTKGTASQTIKALENKGYVARARHSVDRRAVILDISEAGRAALERDPLKLVEAAAAGLASDVEAARSILCRLIEGINSSCRADFGTCAECTHFCRNAVEGETADTHLCGLTSETLTAEESGQICVNFQA